MITAFTPSLKFNPKGDSLSFGDSNGYMVYDINGYAQPELRLAYKKDFVRDISVIERLHHALLLFVVSKLHPKIVRVFDLRNGEVHQLQGFSSDVFSVRASFNLVIVCTADTIRLYVTKNMTLKHAITDIPNPKGLVDMTPLDKKALIAFPCCDVTGRVALFDGLHLKEMRPIEAHNGPIAALKFSPSGDLLATASDKGTVIRLFDVDTGTRVFEFSRGFVRYAHIHCLSFSADSRYLASTSSTGTLHLYELDSRFREMGNTEREESLISSYTNYFWKQTEHYMPAVVRPKSIASASLFTSQDAASICTFRAVDGKQFVLVASTDGYFFVYEFTEGSPVLTLLQQWRIGDKGGEKNDFADILSERHSLALMHFPSCGRSLFRRFSTGSVFRRSTFIGGDKYVRIHPIAGKKPKITDLKNAFDAVRSGDNIYVHSLAATPTPLLKGLVDHARENSLSNITLHHLVIDGHSASLLQEAAKGVIRANSLFTGSSMRQAVNEGAADFNSIFLSEIPLLFRRCAIELNVALVHVCPPDAEGYCSLGTGVEATRAALNNADHVIAMVNKNMPRTYGDGVVHSSHFDVMVEAHYHELFESLDAVIGEKEKKIGALIAENLVDDGATLQIGLGGIPNAILPALKRHRDLGIHTEMFSDGALDLIDRGVVNNKLKNISPGKIVTGFVHGTRKLYDFVDDNPLVEFGDVQWVNDPSIIRQNPKVTAINAAIEVDLTGQVASDSVGKLFFSGFGGQVDYIRGAALSNDGLGRPIIAMPSTTKKGETKIVPFLREGGGVVTTRAHVHYVVTDFGIAQLWGKNMRQRAYELIQIAHPDHRESLEKSAFERLKVMPSAD